MASIPRDAAVHRRGQGRGAVDAAGGPGSSVRAGGGVEQSGCLRRELPVGRRMRAVLVGPIQQENLALGYLASYARSQGHEVTLVAYADRHDLDATIEAVLAAQPGLVGLGIAFQNNVDDYLLLLRTLRQRGYRGHLTCGGHV